MSSGCEVLGFARVRAAGFGRDFCCLISSRFELLGLAGRNFLKRCTVEIRQDVSCWVYLGCELLDSVGIELVGLRRERFRPAVHC